MPPPWSRDGNSVRDSRRELALGNAGEYWGVAVPAEATRGGPLEVKAKLASETNAPEATTLAVEGSPPPPLPRRTCEVVGSLWKLVCWEGGPLGGGEVPVAPFEFGGFGAVAPI